MFGKTIAERQPASWGRLRRIMVAPSAESGVLPSFARCLKSTHTFARTRRGCNVAKEKKAAAELEQIVKVRIGVGDCSVKVAPDPDKGWHATVHGCEPADVHNLQLMANKITDELCQHYQLSD
jgi:hypothetical protein